MNTKSIGRNDPCPCGSGKKYKQCCQNKIDTNNTAAKNRLLESIPDLLKSALKAYEINDITKSITIYEQVLEINPKNVDALNNLGLIYMKLDREKSKKLLSKAVSLQPSAKHYSNLSVVSTDDEAIELLQKAIELNPGDVMYYNNISAILLRKHRYEDAILFAKKALSLDHKYINAISNIGFAFMQLSHYNQASHFFRKAIEIDSLSVTSYLQLLFCLCFDKNAFPNTYLQEATNLEKIWQKKATPFTSWKNINSSGAPLRIGFVSRDFGIHPVGFFLESMIKELFHIDSLELFAYSLRPAYLDDQLTEELKKNFHQWSTIGLLSPEQAAQKIHTDGINILIDLAGYTANSGIEIFTWRPAPIQISWLGYFASTGLSCIDYFIADHIGVPADKQFYFKEKVCYLPESRLCFTAPATSLAPEANSLPALNNGFITFGCFQTLSKVNDHMIRLWSEILRNCKNSKILFKNNQMSDEPTRLAFLKKLEDFGIAKTQVLIESQQSRAEYFSTYHKVDIMLDTYPYPGGTTTCEALWMGVPTLTLTGQTLLERQGHSILHSAGLDDWVCEDEDEYIAKGIDFAKNPAFLNDLRMHLRMRVAHSSLMDAKRFAKNLSTLLHDIWKNHPKK